MTGKMKDEKLTLNSGYDKVHDALFAVARHDSDEECRVLAALALQEFQQKCSDHLTPKIQVLS